MWRSPWRFLIARRCCWPTSRPASSTRRPPTTIFELFHSLNRTFGLTVVIVSHDPNVARYVERVVAIRDGKTSSETMRTE